MNSMCLPVRRTLVALFLAASRLCSLALADSAAAPQAASAPPAVPAPVVKHPQVSMAGFAREYRVIPIVATPADERIREALRAPGPRSIAGNEVLTVTTRNQAQENLVVVTYPLPGDSATSGPPLRRVHERFLAEFVGGKPVVRVHHVGADGARDSLAASLKGVCNDSLGAAGDEDAAVTVVGDGLVVRSKSPEFHALAAQVIAAVGGVIVREPAPGGEGGNGGG